MQPHHLGAIRLARVAVTRRHESIQQPSRQCHVRAVRIFFTIIKGAPSARHA